LPAPAEPRTAKPEPTDAELQAEFDKAADDFLKRSRSKNKHVVAAVVRAMPAMFTSPASKVAAGFYGKLRDDEQEYRTPDYQAEYRERFINFLETAPREVRLALACAPLGIDPAELFEEEIEELVGEESNRKLIATIQEQARDEGGEQEPRPRTFKQLTHIEIVRLKRALRFGGPIFERAIEAASSGNLDGVARAALEVGVTAPPLCFETYLRLRTSEGRPDPRFACQWNGSGAGSLAVRNESPTGSATARPTRRSRAARRTASRRAESGPGSSGRERKAGPRGRPRDRHRRSRGRAMGPFQSELRM
jgi:hypothetical protein